MADLKVHSVYSDSPNPAFHFSLVQIEKILKEVSFDDFSGSAEEGGIVISVPKAAFLTEKFADGPTAVLRKSVNGRAVAAEKSDIGSTAVLKKTDDSFTPGMKKDMRGKKQQSDQEQNSIQEQKKQSVADATEKTAEYAPAEQEWMFYKNAEAIPFLNENHRKLINSINSEGDEAGAIVGPGGEIVTVGYRLGENKDNYRDKAPNKHNNSHDNKAPDKHNNSHNNKTPNKHGGKIPEQKNILSESYGQTVWRRFRRHHLASVSLIILIILGGAALLAPLIAPYDPNAIVGSFSDAPTGEFWLGTDQIGRDVFSRLLYAMRISLLVGIMATLISTVIGVVLGLLAGYFGGLIDMIIMRFTDMVMSFPYILLVLVAASIFKPGLWSIILILGFVDWPGIARLVRGNVLSLRETNFVKSNIVAGMSLRHIIFSEILPNTVAPILVYATSVVALSMLDEAALSFLGMGVQPPTASLGNMLNGAQSLTVLTRQPWLWVPPGLLIVVLVIAINFIGDALRDALDPTSINRR